MLEGKELVGKIADAGTYSVDVTGTGMLKVEVEIDLIAQCEALAKKTETTLDDSFVATLKKLMGR